MKWVTPLGRVFKIHNIFLHYFIGFLTSINYMDKWVTPNGVTHFMLLIDIKILQNHAEKIMDFEHPT